ncbi:hypothetical protein [Spirosoma utsteinense]|nr:hypothetical protein [Spirosoma utsteinense]MBC3787118.1 hypothetical protein [Spirosoma utsteinense]
MVRIKELHEIDLIRWKQERGWKKISEPGRLLGHLFNSHAQIVNSLMGRTGSLFEKHVHRERIDHDDYFTQLIFYIHSNPLKHGFTTSFQTYPHSSYLAYLSDKPTLLKRQAVLDWFGGKQQFINFHEGMKNETFGDYFNDRS